jgi:hypothetical protein
MEAMAMPVVTRTRKEPSPGATHQHIAGVCSIEGVYSTRARVVAGIDRGEPWTTSGGGSTARIKKITFCPHAGCYERPYITTAPDHTTANNLENLPAC